MQCMYLLITELKGVTASYSQLSKRLRGVCAQIRCFGRAKIKARPKHRNLPANPTETLATQATQVTDRVFPHFSFKENDKTYKFIKHVSASVIFS